MKEAEDFPAPNLFRTIAAYIDILKLRETSLLTFIGICAAIIAAGGNPPPSQLLLALVTIALGSGGVNGLTNYFDREIDAKMERTKHRPLPSKHIEPPERALPLVVGLTILALGLAWWLHPLCFLFGLIGTLAAVIGRKRVTCAFPQGTIASCAPVLIGWLAINHELSLQILFLCILIGVWIPLHVWSVMIANRDDYLRTGISYFPLSWEVKKVVILFLGLSFLLYAASIALYFIGNFGIIYLMVASLLGIFMIYANFRLVISAASRDAWRVYKLSAFPYLGLIFLTMCLDLWLV